MCVCVFVHLPVGVFFFLHLRELVIALCGGNLVNVCFADTLTVFNNALRY